MKHTIGIKTLEDRQQEVTVTWENGLVYTTTAIGTPEQAKWHVENAIVPDMQMRYPELRGDI